jgi:hypothetical protein
MKLFRTILAIQKSDDVLKQPGMYLSQLDQTSFGIWKILRLKDLSKLA